MFDRLLFEDDTFRVTAGMLGGMKVTLEDRKITRSAPREFVEHFLQTTEALKGAGG